MFGSGVFMCFLFFSYLRGSAATYLSNVFNAFRLTIVGSTTNNLGCTTNNLEGVTHGTGKTAQRLGYRMA